MLNRRECVLNRCIQRMSDESGQDLPEYAMLLGLIALAVLTSVTLLGEETNNVLVTIGTALAGMGIP